MLERLISQNNAYCQNGTYDGRMCVKLVNNYRSHHTIIEVPKQLFYDGILNECAGDIRNLFVNMKWDLLPNKKFPCIFHPVYGKEEQEGEQTSFSFHRETHCLRSSIALTLVLQRTLDLRILLNFTYYWPQFSQQYQIL
jgi:hypothetical protein